MKIQKQPNRWSCLPTSFAMILDVDVNELIRKIGHDGSEILWPNLEEPYCRRAFHIEEIAMVCYGLGYYLVWFNIELTSNSGLCSTENLSSELDKLKLEIVESLNIIPKPNDKIDPIIQFGNVVYKTTEKLSKKISYIQEILSTKIINTNEGFVVQYLMDKHHGVLLGKTVNDKPHCVAWNYRTKELLCPTIGGPIPHDSFFPETFIFLTFIR